MTHRKYDGMFLGTSRFTTSTRMKLERTVGRALFGQRCTRMPLRTAVCSAVHELRSQGLDLAGMLTLLGEIVEDAGRTCGADRTSLLSREPLWMAVRAEVLDTVAHADAESALLLVPAV